MATTLRIAVVANDRGVTEPLDLRLQSRGYRVVPLAQISAVLGFIYSDPPDLILIDVPGPDTSAAKLVQKLKAESGFGTIPVIGVIHESRGTTLDWERCPLDDFIAFPIHYPELFDRIALSLQRIRRVFDNNPLSKLPGNTSIQHAIEQVLGKPMAVCYLDINDFKPYNDTYGFARGDEVLRMVARIVSNAVAESGEGGFAGHIGGDDFVFIVPIDRAEKVCKTIIANFNTIIADLFEDETKATGYYLAKDRGGQTKQIPLLGVVIAVVPTAGSAIEHYGKVAAVAAEIKSFAKKSGGSRYVVDRRRP
jgi:GGDEF domain-containing protein